MIRDYRHFLTSYSFKIPLEHGLGHLLNNFNSSNLSVQSGLMDKNHGFSVLGTASPESKIPSCKLLFLRMEDIDNWSDILQSQYPGIHYIPEKSALSRCPRAAEHVKALHDYQMTEFEIKNVIMRYGN